MSAFNSCINHVSPRNAAVLERHLYECEVSTMYVHLHSHYTRYSGITHNRSRQLPLQAPKITLKSHHFTLEYTNTSLNPLASILVRTPPNIIKPRNVQRQILALPFVRRPRPPPPTHLRLRLRTKQRPESLSRRTLRAGGIHRLAGGAKVVSGV